jgi:ATP synthase F1 gamma subunit
MPSSRELQNHIARLKGLQSSFKAYQIVSTQRENIVREQSRLEEAHYENIHAILETLQSTDPLLLSEHPLATPHPDAKKTHVVLISMSSGMLCQPPIAKQKEYIRTHFPPEKTILTPIGEEAHKIVQGINATTHDKEQIPIDLTKLQDIARTISIEIRKRYADPGEDVASTHIVYIRQNLDVGDDSILPIPLPDGDGLTTATGMSVEGNAWELLDRVLNEYLTAILYNSLLETNKSEHLSRKLASHRAAKNIEETLPGLEREANVQRRADITKEMQGLEEQED